MGLLLCIYALFLIIKFIKVEDTPESKVWSVQQLWDDKCGMVRNVLICNKSLKEALMGIEALTWSNQSSAHSPTPNRTGFSSQISMWLESCFPNQIRYLGIFFSWMYIGP